MVDWAGLVEPLDGNPVGPDLSYDAERVAIEDVVATWASGERAEDVNWRDVIARVQAQAARTRDLWLGIYWARAGAMAGALDAVADGVQLLAALIETHWDMVHPQLDEMGFLGRKSVCDGLARHAEFIQPRTHQKVKVRLARTRRPKIGRPWYAVSCTPMIEPARIAFGQADVLPGNHAIGKLAHHVEASDAARPFHRGSDHRRAA